MTSVQRKSNFSALTVFMSFLLLLCYAGFAESPEGSSIGNMYYMYVCAESDDEVSVVRFDGHEAVVQENISVGVIPVEIEGPHGITVSPDGEYWYLSMAHGKPFGHVYKYSTSDNEVLGRVELDYFPATMQVSPSTGMLYVVNFNLHGDHVPSSVSVVDPESMTEIERITTGVMPHGSRLSPDGMYHYSVAMMSGELFEIDALSLEITRRLDVGKSADMDGKMHHMKDGEETHSDHDMHEDHDASGHRRNIYRRLLVLALLTSW